MKTATIDDLCDLGRMSCASTEEIERAIADNVGIITDDSEYAEDFAENLRECL